MQSDTTVRGVVAVVPRDGRLLVVRRSQFVIAPGTYCFPGGRIESGETEAEALVREMREELHVEAEPIRLLWRSVTPWHAKLAWWLATLDADADLRPREQEVESVQWLELAELRALDGLLESNLHFLDAWADGEFELDPQAG